MDRCRAAPVPAGVDGSRRTASVEPRLCLQSKQMRRRKAVKGSREA